MVQWIKSNIPIITTILVTVGIIVFIYGCEPKTHSIDGSNKMVTRQELQVQLNQVLGTAELRMADLDRQEQLRAIILQNALVLVEGQPFNPVGLISAIAAIYGISTGSYQVGKKVKTISHKRKKNNGTT